MHTDALAPTGFCGDPSARPRQADDPHLAEGSPPKASGRPAATRGDPGGGPGVDPAPPSGSKPRRPAQFEGPYVEALLLNLDASLSVHTRGHLFGWTQGLLQTLIPHKALICVLRTGDANSFCVDSHSSLVPDAALLGDSLLRDSTVLPGIIGKWKECSFRPALCAGDAFGPSGGGPFAQELKRIDALELLVHGDHDVNAEVTSLFLFACAAGSIGARETYVAQLIVPLLHAALVRSQSNPDERGQDELREAPVGGAVLTEREREILHWVYLGKSNGEIGAILEISPLTVKNHVQKILRKLDVVNRAQAVGKALDARIIRP